MFIKTICPHCNKASYVDIGVKITETRSDMKLKKVNVNDTITDIDFTTLITEFIFNNQLNNCSREDLQQTLSDIFGISPQCIHELIMT